MRNIKAFSSNLQIKDKKILQCIYLLLLQSNSLVEFSFKDGSFLVEVGEYHHSSGDITHANICRLFLKEEKWVIYLKY